MSIYPDISHYDPVQIWQTVKKNCPFLISKATQGTSFIDPTLNSFIKECEANKIPYWLYTYLNNGNELAQAKFLVSTCKNKVGSYFRGYALDVEAGNTAANIKSALDYISALGGKCMIYTMWADYDKYKSVITSRPSNCAWWEARYGLNNGSYNSKYPCHPGVDLHQYTDQGRCRGIGSGIDLNRLTGAKKESWFTGDVSNVSTKKYTVTFQTETKYKVVRYGGNSVYNSACGPASLCNALRAAGIADVNLLTMCKLAVSCGARVDGGTDMGTLLKAASKKYGFTYSMTSKNADLLAHLKAGGTAILHGGSSYKLFSYGGHFVSAVGVSGQTITVLDSYWYDGKYTATTLRKNNVKVIAKGVIKTGLSQCGKATIDRAPSYYLISRKTVRTTKRVNARSGAGVTKRKLGTINKGAKLTVLDETKSWIKTSVWIAKKHCELEDGKATTKAVLAVLNARASNSIKADKLGTIRKGMTMPVLETTENWVRVPVWVARKYTKQFA